MIVMLILVMVRVYKILWFQIMFEYIDGVVLED